MNAIQILDRPIAFHRCFVGITKSVAAALMLSQAIYWTNRIKDNRDGWFWKTAEEWEEETGLTRREQEAARRTLRASGFWEEVKRGVPCRLFFRVDAKKLSAALGDKTSNGSLVQFSQKVESSFDKSAKPVSTKREN